jgi:hypothetical protein
MRKTIYGGIPKAKSKTDFKIGMDTLNDREGLHFWICNDKKMVSVHLTREDARNLIEEIKDRLF